MKKNKRVAIITGASRGLGAAIAKKLSLQNMSLAIVFKNSKEKASTIANECKQNGAETLTIQADVSIDSECRKVVEETINKLGEINILINNVGKTKFVDFEDLEGLSDNDFLDIYKTNVVSAFMMTRAAVPSMKKTANARIINISSIAGVLGVGSSIAYAASKGGLNMLSYSLARALAPDILVNTICPGYIQTSWHGNQHEVEKKKKKYEESVPLKKSASPEDIAETVLWFVNSPNLITGETLMVDGGLHLNQ